MMRRTTTLLLSLALVAALPAFSLPRREAFGPPEEAGHRGAFFPLQVLARFLELTPEQVEETTLLLEELRAAVAPRAEELADLRAELGDLLAGEAPDPAAVGHLVLDVHDLGDQIRDLRAGFEADFEALLTPDQRLRYEAFRAAARALRGPRGRHHGGGPGGPGPGGASGPGASG